MIGGEVEEPSHGVEFDCLVAPTASLCVAIVVTGTAKAVGESRRIRRDDAPTDGIVEQATQLRRVEGR